jgi:hypothetical protein
LINFGSGKVIALLTSIGLSFALYGILVLLFKVLTPDDIDILPKKFLKKI